MFCIIVIPLLHIYYKWWLQFQLFQRVKVYRLTDGGKWDDQGTGHVSIDYIEVRKISLLIWVVFIISYVWL